MRCLAIAIRKSSISCRKYVITCRSSCSPKSTYCIVVRPNMIEIGPIIFVSIVFLKSHVISHFSKRILTDCGNCFGRRSHCVIVKCISTAKEGIHLYFPMMKMFHRIFLCISNSMVVMEKNPWFLVPS